MYIGKIVEWKMELTNPISTSERETKIVDERNERLEYGLVQIIVLIERTYAIKTSETVE